MNRDHPENHTIRPAVTSDYPAILELLPQLTDFNVPERRDPTHLWQGDAVLAEQVLQGQAPTSYCDVAVDHHNQLCGLILVTLRPELLSQAASAHLEAIVVAPQARGQGLGRELLEHAESSAQAHGATSLTLHVFANNQRARALYDQQGYDSELIRAIKWLD
ncbi:MAG: N-acetyltransferase [Pseudomonadota bacterium]